MTARILVVDDHPISREGLSLAARVASDGFIVDCVGSVAEAESIAFQRKGYRLAILDLVLPDTRGFSGFLRVQHALGGTPIVLISAIYNVRMIEAAKALGAKAYVSKTESLDNLVPVLRSALMGASLFQSSFTPGSSLLERAYTQLDKLSAAQKRTLLAIPNGGSNKQIAGELGITEATVKAHLSASFRKLGVHNRMQAMILLQPIFSPAAEFQHAVNG